MRYHLEIDCLAALGFVHKSKGDAWGVNRWGLEKKPYVLLVVFRMQ